MEKKAITKYVWIASDNTNGRWYELENETRTGKEIAYYLGRAESGEIIEIFDESKEGEPAERYFWDWQYRKYRKY